MMMLQTIAWISLCAAVLCAAVIVVHEIRHQQKMMVMNFVWPITALYLSVFGCVDVLSVWAEDGGRV